MCKAVGSNCSTAGFACDSTGTCAPVAPASAPKSSPTSVSQSSSPLAGSAPALVSPPIFVQSPTQQSPVSPPAGAGCASQPNFPTGSNFTCIGSSWVLTGALTIPASTIFNVTLSPTLSPIVVEGCVDISNTSSTLSLTLDPQQVQAIINSSLSQVVLLQSNRECLTGKFSSVEIICPDQSVCSQACVGSDQQSNPRSLTVLFNTGCQTGVLFGGVQTWVVVVAVIGSLVLLVVIFIIVAATVPRFRRRIFPFLERNKHTPQNDDLE